MSQIYTLWKKSFPDTRIVSEDQSSLLLTHTNGIASYKQKYYLYQTSLPYVSESYISDLQRYGMNVKRVGNTITHSVTNMSALEFTKRTLDALNKIDEEERVIILPDSDGIVDVNGNGNGIGIKR